MADGRVWVVSPAEVEAAGNAYLARYDDGRRELAVLRQRLRQIGQLMSRLGSEVDGKRPITGESHGHRPATGDTLDLYAEALGQFVPTVTEYRETRRIVDDLYRTLVALGRGESIKDLSEFPDY